MRPLGQLSERLRGGMPIFVKTLPPCQLSSLPAYVAMHASLAWTRVGVGWSSDGRDGPCYCPDKASGHLSSAFNALCPVMTGDKLVYCIPFHLLCATVTAPFDYKMRLAAY